MCGIVALFAYGSGASLVDREEVRRIRDAMARRGPDGDGEWFSEDGRVGLGHRRLAIIDLSPSGAQPMASDDGALELVYNGEIYNYRELRADLEREGGRPFRSTSDTEVILRLYERDGERAIAALRGMFTIALWDGRRKGLLLARDPFGIKPLYYADDGATIRVASQVKALRAGARVGGDPDPAGVAGFFLWGSVPEPHTLFREIHQLPAGSVLWVDGPGPREARSYVSLSEIFLTRRNGHEESDRARPDRVAERREAAREAFLDSVAHHLVADVPVGAFLSAGIDSTSLVALAREIDAAPLRTVTLSFEEYRGTPFDEAPLAEATAARLGTRHETRLISRSRFLEEIPRLMDAMDQPSMDGVNSYFVCQAAAEAGLKVALSGLGGDELLGGYPSFRDLRWLVRGAAIPSRIPGLGRTLRPVLSPLLRGRVPQRYAGLFELGGSWAGGYLLRKGLFAPWELPDLLGQDLAREGVRLLDPTGAAASALRPDPGTAFARVSVLEASLFMKNQLLRDSDWASMAHSLELRVPLVDLTLWRALARLLGPSGRLHGKALLAGAPRPPLPAMQVQRKKTGFGVPVWDWLAGSPQLDVWKRAPLLHGPGFQGARRWAYTVFNAFAGDLLAR